MINSSSSLKIIVNQGREWLSFPFFFWALGHIWQPSMIHEIQQSLALCHESLPNGAQGTYIRDWTRACCMQSKCLPHCSIVFISFIAFLTGEVSKHFFTLIKSARKGLLWPRSYQNRGREKVKKSATWLPMFMPQAHPLQSFYSKRENFFFPIFPVLVIPNHVITMPVLGRENPEPDKMN